ncbi:MAG TPA: CBS domain-containing protein [Methylomirabilota bacterium]|jgi:CBS domain-containing protein|nr:CBS domain-containing protein [Methylomirabilota bacterium]
MTVATILARKGLKVVTIQPEQTLREALAMLAQHSIGAVLVTDARGALVGILSERDVVREAVRNEKFFDLAVSAIMTSNVITGQPQDDVSAVATTMTNKRFRHLPVLDGGKIVGVISLGDIVKAQRDEYLGAIDTLETQIIGERAS